MTRRFDEASTDRRPDEAISLALAAHARCERAHGLRVTFVNVTALLSLPVGLGAVFPNLLSAANLRLVLASWGCGALGSAFALVGEWWWNGRRTALIEQARCERASPRR